MLYGSIDRTIYNLGLNPLDVPTRREISAFLTELSPRLEKYIGRDIELKERPYLFDTTHNKLEYFTRCIDIQSITSIKKSFLGTYGSGSDITLTLGVDYIIGPNNDSIILMYPPFDAKNGLQAVITGGLATKPTITSAYYTVLGDPIPLQGKYVSGQDTEAVARIKSLDSVNGIIYLDVISGIFDCENLFIYEDVNFTNAYNAATLCVTSFIARGLAEVAPNILKALDNELRFWRQHKDDFENERTGKEGTYRRKREYDSQVRSHVQPETHDLICDYIKVNFF